MVNIPEHNLSVKKSFLAMIINQHRACPSYLKATWRVAFEMYPTASLCSGMNLFSSGTHMLVIWNIGKGVRLDANKMAC